MLADYMYIALYIVFIFTESRNELSIYVICEGYHGINYNYLKFSVRVYVCASQTVVCVSVRINVNYYTACTGIS